MKTVSKTAIGAGIAAVALIGAYYGACASLRYTREDARNLFVGAEKELRDAAIKAPDTVLPMLEKMKGETVLRARFRNDWRSWGRSSASGPLTRRRNATVPPWTTA